MPSPTAAPPLPDLSLVVFFLVTVGLLVLYSVVLVSWKPQGKATTLEGSPREGGYLAILSLLGKLLLRHDTRTQKWPQTGRQESPPPPVP